MRDTYHTLRVRWDLPPGEDSATDHYVDWCGQLINAGMKSLSLWDMLFPSPGSSLILEYLRDTDIEVSLTIAGLVAPPRILASLQGRKIHRLYFDVRSFDELRETISELKRFRRSGTAVGISFTVSGFNYWDMPDVLLYSRINGIDAITVHMPRPFNGAPFFIGRHDRQDLAHRLREIDFAGMDLIIDDPFLRRLCPPGARTSGNACQAAKTTIYISPEAQVFPCPSMPVRLGSLREKSLGEILGSGLRQEILEWIAFLPEACCACPDVRDCNGGCRGRAYALHGSFQGADPACCRPSSQYAFP